MNLQPIVEGDGEVAAVPVLLRRFRDLAQAHPLEVNAPIKRHRDEFFEEAKVQKAVRLAKKYECDAILLLVDGDNDGDCPATRAPQILGWAQAEAAGTPCAVVMAYREYEAWFLASIESLRGHRGIRQDAESHPLPEQPKGAKAKLEERMEAGKSYHETADQPALTGLFDMQPAYKKYRSFQHMVKVFGELATAGGSAPSADWPPAEWQEAEE
jgi:hypothetical protein